MTLLVCVCLFTFVSLCCRWMEKVSLEVTASCGHPPELRGQNVVDVQVFTSCPESGSRPDQEVIMDPKPPQAKKPKPSLPKAMGVKARPAKPKVKQSKPTKKQPQRKPAITKVSKNKKTIK